MKFLALTPRMVAVLTRIAVFTALAPATVTTAAPTIIWLEAVAADIEPGPGSWLIRVAASFLALIGMLGYFMVWAWPLAVTFLAVRSVRALRRRFSQTSRSDTRKRARAPVSGVHPAHGTTECALSRALRAGGGWFSQDGEFRMDSSSKIPRHRHRYARHASLGGPTLLLSHIVADACFGDGETLWTIDDCCPNAFRLIARRAADHPQARGADDAPGEDPAAPPREDRNCGPAWHRCTDCELCLLGRQLAPIRCAQPQRCWLPSGADRCHRPINVTHRIDCYHRQDMNPTVSRYANAMLAETSLITKIITGIGLALLLVVGVWSGDVHNSETSMMTVSAAPAPSPNASSADAEGNAAGSAFIEDSIDAVMIGVAGCLLGIACCFLVLVVRRTLSGRVPLRALSRLPRMLVPLPTTGRPFTAPLSLTQLSLSRI